MCTPVRVHAVDRVGTQRIAADVEYMKTFITTYRSFTSPYVLFAKLVQVGDNKLLLIRGCCEH